MSPPLYAHEPLDQFLWTMYLISFNQMMCGLTTAFRLEVSWVSTFYEDWKSRINGNKFQQKNPGVRLYRLPVEIKIYKAKALPSALAGPA